MMKDVMMKWRFWKHRQPVVAPNPFWFSLTDPVDNKRFGRFIWLAFVCAHGSSYIFLWHENVTVVIRDTIVHQGCPRASSSCIIRKVVIHMLHRITLVPVVCHMKTNMYKKASEHMSFRAHTRNVPISTDKRAFLGSSHDQCDCSFTYSTSHHGLGCVCNVNVCVIGSDLTWWQHIVLSNSWPSRCPTCDEPLLPRWKMWPWLFWQFGGYM
jgi:hypothetical protein